jgi:hypothetical protein
MIGTHQSDDTQVLEDPTTKEPGSSRQSLVEVCLDRSLEVWRDPIGLQPSRLLVPFFAGLTVICGATAFIGAVPTRIYGHDIFVWLAGGWRAINGQRPHIDFASPFGPFMFLLSGLGLTISHQTADGIGYASAIMALVVGTWSFFLGQNRLASSPRIILSFFLAALVAAPYPLGLSPFMSSHAMLYNRYGYALIGIILLELFKAAPSLRRKQEDGWAGGISTGAALGLTLFLKASYFFVSLILIGVISLLLRRLTRQRILGIISGFSLVAICMLAYLRFDVSAMLADLRMAAGARASALKSPVGALLNHASVLLGVVLLAISTTLFLSSRVPQWRDLKLIMIGALLFFADVGLLVSNAQFGDFPLTAVFAILVLNEITEHHQSLPGRESHSCRASYVAVLSLGALLFIPQFTSDLGGLGYGAWRKYKTKNGREVSRFTSPNLRPLLLYDAADNPVAEGHLFTEYVNDGVALLERETRPSETILTMDATNPFPYAMGRRPPRGGHAAGWYPSTITLTYRPSDDRYFGDADIVMVPKRSSQGDRNWVIYKAYEAGLKQGYDLAAESSLWWMYRRK